jgi:hypothetical protein
MVILLFVTVAVTIGVLCGILLQIRLRECIGGPTYECMNGKCSNQAPLSQRGEHRVMKIEWAQIQNFQCVPALQLSCDRM